MRVPRPWLVVLALALPATASATDGHFLHGVGAINSAMGGAGVASPRSLLGTFYLNPAGLMAFDGTRMEFSFELFKPARTVASSVPGFGGGSTTSGSDFSTVPAMGVSIALNDRTTIGLGAVGIGGFGVDYPLSLTNPILAPPPNGFGQVYSNYTFLKLSPSLAHAFSPKLWVGASLNVDYATLAVQPAPMAAPTGGYYPWASSASGAWGFGFQLGLLYKASDRIWLGASYTSNQWFEDFSWNSVDENPNTPPANLPRTITFRMDAPAVAMAGVQLRPVERVTVAGDLRYYFYESTKGFDESGFNQDGSVKGFGWQNILAAAVGVDVQATPTVAVRAGYNYSDNPIPSAQSMFNVPAPAVVQHHATFGLGWQVIPTLEVSAAYYHAFEGSVSGPLYGPTGPITGSDVTNRLSEDSFLIQFSITPR
jgi:long-chain fatty acid transport protein